MSNQTLREIKKTMPVGPWRIVRTAAVARPAPAPAIKEPLPPPVGKGGELWQAFYKNAVDAKQPNPEKYADSFLRAREASQKMTEARHKTLVTSSGPRPPTAAAAAGKAPAKKKAAGAKCQARTLEGRPCSFGATHGCFCKKHHVPGNGFTMISPVAAAKALEGSCLRGVMATTVSKVCDVFGRPNGAPNENLPAIWNIEFDDGTIVSAYFRKSDPTLHIDGFSVNAVAAVRKALSA
jgi:hypothetical protein